MKTITISLPTTFKEMKESAKNKLKWLIAPKRRFRNREVMIHLEAELYRELKSGYWDNDISATMRKRLTCGYPNGIINRIVNKAYKDLI